MPNETYPCYLCGGKDEVIAASKYYQDKQHGLGEDLHEEWVKTVERIMLAPRGYQIKRKHFRHALLERFPYLVVFELTSTEGYHLLLHQREKASEKTVYQA